MDPIVILAIAVVVLLGVLKIAKNARDLGVNLKETNCPECGQPLPRVRKPANMRQALWGGSTCPNCGCEVDRAGQKVN